jgi:tRNA(Ile)-lysidine synthase
VAIALSGGADSTALLIACAAKWPGQVAAIHVHHGLQAAADGFVSHCEALCAALQVPLAVQRVNARHASGQSPEDAARDARYAALALAVASAIGPLCCRSVALAQHADDQVETLLLALSRGSGLPGLAGMPATRDVDGIPYHRPLLDVPASAIRSWLVVRGAAYVDDPSNADQGLTRNRIRAQVLPALEQALPTFRDTFARSARHAAQAQQVLQEVAQEDLAHAACAAGLAIDRLRSLSRPRQANLLRHWLRMTHQTVPSASQLDELLDQLAACATRGHRIQIKVGRGFVRRRGPDLTWYNAAAEPGPTG